MNPTLIRILAAREGGTVRRCHGTPSLFPYDVGRHSYNAVSMLYLLHPDPSHALVKALLWHDVAERWLGDMPSPAKRNNPDLAAVYEKIEASYLTRLGFAPRIDDDDQAWLRGLDYMELWFWAQEELRSGNSYYATWVRGIGEALTSMSLEGKLPEPLKEFWWSLNPNTCPPPPRLSDRFMDVIGGLGPIDA